MIAVRGRVYRADLGYGLKPFLVVSNNQRNRKLDTVLAVRLTKTMKPEMPSIVVLGSADPLSGRVLCDDITEIGHDEFKQDLGALSRASMNEVAQGLAHALGIN